MLLLAALCTFICSSIHCNPCSAAAADVGIALKGGLDAAGEQQLLVFVAAKCLPFELCSLHSCVLFQQQSTSAVFKLPGKTIVSVL
jgi:hypothetical protein